MNLTTKNVLQYKNERDQMNDCLDIYDRIQEQANIKEGLEIDIQSIDRELDRTKNSIKVTERAITPKNREQSERDIEVFYQILASEKQRKENLIARLHRVDQKIFDLQSLWRNSRCSQFKPLAI